MNSRHVVIPSTFTLPWCTITHVSIKKNQSFDAKFIFVCAFILPKNVNGYNNVCELNFYVLKKKILNVIYTCRINSLRLGILGFPKIHRHFAKKKKHIPAELNTVQFLQCSLPVSGTRCLECVDMPHPQDCTKVTTCTPYEICYVEQFVTSGGLILYNSGCLAKDVGFLCWYLVAVGVLLLVVVLLLFSCCCCLYLLFIFRFCSARTHVSLFHSLRHTRFKWSKQTVLGPSVFLSVRLSAGFNLTFNVWPMQGRVFITGMTTAS